MKKDKDPSSIPQNRIYHYEKTNIRKEIRDSKEFFKSLRWLYTDEKSHIFSGTILRTWIMFFMFIGYLFFIYYLVFPTADSVVIKTDDGTTHREIIVQKVGLQDIHIELLLTLGGLLLGNGLLYLGRGFGKGNNGGNNPMQNVLNNIPQNPSGPPMADIPSNPFMQPGDSGTHDNFKN